MRTLEGDRVAGRPRFGESDRVVWTPVPAGARCALHPDTLAADVCTRCGAFACSECAVYRTGGPFCTSCGQRAVTAASASRIAIAAAIVGFLGLACAPLSLAALVLGGLDLAHIRSGRSPAGGRALALWGLLLGALGVLLGVIALVRMVAGEVSLD